MAPLLRFLLPSLPCTHVAHSGMSEMISGGSRGKSSQSVPCLGIGRKGKVGRTLVAITRFDFARLAEIHPLASTLIHVEAPLRSVGAHGSQEICVL
ncbi:hypothetical protein BKA56DRAFT_171155 [Ilyonectria sp. MPI-CAGE-AT-0026]|nr:hypothetical protein BKA56DRAFT_171155 [Ilyonectria sp. MPI-CAGE-AT-0026]